MYSVNLKIIVGCCEDDNISIYDHRNSSQQSVTTLLHNEAGDAISNLRFSPLTKILAVVWRNGIIGLWRINF